LKNGETRLGRFLKDRSSSEPFRDDAKQQLSAPFFSWIDDYITRDK
jgi:hypothetical protein